MKDIRRTFKILTKKYGLWTLLMAVVLLVAQSMAVQSNLESMHRSFEQSYKGILLIDFNSNADQVPKRDYHEVDKKFKKEDIQKLTELTIKNYDRTKASEEGEDIASIDSYLFFLADYGEYPDGKQPDFYQSDTQLLQVIKNINTLDGTKILGYGNAAITFLALVLGIMLTSGEHLTPFYQFSRTLPWPRWKDLLSKTLLGTLSIALFYLLMLGINYLMLINSPMRELFTFNYMDRIYFPLIGNLGLYFLVLGIGCFAGNFLGHLGMLGMAYAGIELYTWDLEMLYQILTNFNENTLNLVTRFGKQIDKLPEILRTVISPWRTMRNSSGTWAIGFLILGLVYLVLGFFYNEHANPERSGMMILNPGLSKYIFAMAVLTTTVILSSIFFDIGTASYGFIGYLAFALFFYISYKVYKVLFKIRIGV